MQWCIIADAHSTRNDEMPVVEDRSESNNVKKKTSAKVPLFDGKSIGTIPTQRGRIKKVHNGHYYNLDQEKKSRYWRCDRWRSDKCPGRLVEYPTGELRETANHNHSANYGKADALLFVHRAKKQAAQNVSKKFKKNSQFLLILQMVEITPF